MPDDREIDDRKVHQELLTLYNNGARNVDRITQRQWTEFYAILVSEAAVTGFATCCGGPNRFHLITPFPVFLMLILLLLVLGLILIWMEQENLGRARNLMERYNERLTDEWQSILGSPDAQPRFRTGYALLMMLVLVIASFFFGVFIASAPTQLSP